MRPRHQLRLPLLVIVALLGVAGCGGSSSSTTASSSGPEKVRLGLVQGQDFIHAMPARVAVQQGFFTKQGLDVSVVDFSSGSDLTKAMAGGSIDVGAATGLDAVSAAAHGIKLQAFYGVYGANPMALIVPTSSTVSGFADLRGKKVGISKLGSLTDFVTRSALHAVGVPLTAVTEVPLGDPASTMAALDRGDIDALVLPVNFGYVEEMKGKGRVAQQVGALLGSDSQFAILMAKADYVSADATTLKKVAAAYSDAIRWMQANGAATQSLATDKLGMQPTIAQKTYTAVIGGFTPEGTISATGMQAYAKALPDLKIAPTVPAEADYLTSAIVPEG